MAAPVFQEQDEFVGTMLADKYLIVRRIGRGGMGAVYEANHVLIDRKVAIKVVRPHYAQSDPACLQRFRLEAKASSCLSHKNIMTVFDFGITDDGVAYLVMDYISGEGLDVAMKREGAFDVEKAVSIFAQACDALAHAHDKGVIHRDLKPSNIMLVDDDGKTTVKIVDFGIAKMLPGRARSAEVINDGGQVIGSPLYMSPEQCMGDDQDGRADIYALGCLLYEVLTGIPPMSDKHVLGIMYKHLNEPPKPFSTVVPHFNVPGPVEAVVMKALAKKPEHRHQGMRELAAELRTALAEAKSVDKDLNYVNRAEAAEFLFTEESHEFPKFQETRSTCDPIEQHYLRQLRSAADQFGAHHPEVVAPMHHVADYYISRNKPVSAERHLRNAIEVLVENYGAWDIRVAEGVLKLAELYRDGGRAYDAEPLYQDLLAIKKNALGRNHPDIPFLMLRLAELYLTTSQTDKAYKYYSQCLRSAEAIFGPDDPVLSAVIIGLAAVLVQMERLDQAAWLYHRALELNEFNLGVNHPAVIGPLVSLGVVYRKLENWDDAERALHRAISVHRATCDQDNSEICHAYWLLAEVYSHRGMHEHAEKLYEHVLAFFERQKGDDESVAQLYNNYGVHFLRRENSESAEAQFIKALKIRERKYGRSSEQVAASLNLIATLYHAQEKLELAEEYYRRSLSACNENPTAAELASENLRALGDLYMAQERYDEAEPAYIKAMEVLSTEADPTQQPDTQTQQIMNSLLNMYMAANSARAPQNEQV